LITAGEYKRTLTLLGENTEKGREKFVEEIEDTHLLFKEFVTQHRPELDIEKVATGEHWFGQRALDRGLVDELITSDEYKVRGEKNAAGENGYCGAGFGRRSTDAVVGKRHFLPVFLTGDRGGATLYSCERIVVFPLLFLSVERVYCSRNPHFGEQETQKLKLTGFQDS
jgi:hypothetical protein